MAETCPSCKAAEMTEKSGISKNNKPYRMVKCQNKACGFIEWLPPFISPETAPNNTYNDTQRDRVVDNRPEPTPQPTAKVQPRLTPAEIKFLVEISRDLVIERMRQQGGSDSVLPADFLINTFERLKEIYSV